MSLQEVEASIRVRAYEIWEAAGRPEGHADEHWFEAMNEAPPLAPSMVTPNAPAPKKAAKKKAAELVVVASEPEMAMKAPARKWTVEAKT